ncbi:TetR/AcrR family transcriptional regulator [Actinacidiphila sp. DG2A-62]|jgi:AcrR family transcriptional regulator|uniref:TetR/AcrR family transcriptional regulator n=1 Tax=Actinacidiphila sp. DG2A-62 TaxID=3108821 RepID=UPI002DBB7FD6|nr:TetR/AcrR family transcriptional regulator [Actinacidiphila sp. DG2A-62]MEC3993837.1 TetR/AcrR family transcriptional regulator [Actinacidiphila sp. DG2A-62]
MTDEMAGRRRPGRPAQISRDKIVEAVSLAENVDTLTMRELATRLGVSHAALYRWVKNRDELFDLVSEVVVERILARADAGPPECRAWLARLAWAMHDEFLALPGYATHLSRPHEHNAHSVDRLRSAVGAVLRRSGVTDEMTGHSWQIFITCVVGWLATTENSLRLGTDAPRFDLFLDTLLRGLPAREPGARRP